MYSITGGGENNLSSYDPEKSLIINPQANSAYAYFKTDKNEGVVYSNKYSIVFSDKVSYNVDGGSMSIDEANSTKNKVSYLELSKTLYYAPPQTEQDTVELFYYHDNYMTMFNDAKFTDGKLIQYDIIGESVGTSPVSQVTLVDILPPGLIYKSSEYYFSRENGVFKHKLSRTGGKEALVFDAELNEVLKSGDKFIIRVCLEVKKNRMEKIF